MKINFRDYEKSYIQRALPIKYLSRGILASEGFAFCGLSDYLDIDMIIESGVYNGLSTFIWAKYFKDIQIISIDKEIRDVAVNNLKSFNNIELCNGSSVKLLPLLIKNNADKKIAVFIDGPKGAKAIKLGRQCFEYPNVKLVGVHDVNKLCGGRMNPTRIFAGGVKEISFYTDDSKFVDDFKYMDIPENYIGRGNEAEYWEPYQFIDKATGEPRFIGSYGPTIAFMIKEN